MCWSSSGLNDRSGIRGWSGYRMGSRGCRLGRSNGGCRRCRRCIRFWWSVVTWSGIRCRVVCRPGGPGIGAGLGCRWFAPLEPCPGCLEPGEVDALFGACRMLRDRAMFEAMVFGGLRRCEVLGLRLGDLDGARRQVFIVEGKGGHQRQIPISGRWFTTVGDYCGPNDRRGPTPTGCSLFSRVNVEASRCPRRA